MSVGNTTGTAEDAVTASARRTFDRSEQIRSKLGWMKVEAVTCGDIGRVDLNQGAAGLLEVGVGRAVEDLVIVVVDREVTAVVEGGEKPQPIVGQQQPEQEAVADIETEETIFEVIEDDDPREGRSRPR